MGGPRVLAGPGVYDDFVAALAEQAKATQTTFANGPGDEDAMAERLLALVCCRHDWVATPCVPAGLNQVPEASWNRR